MKPLLVTALVLASCLAPAPAVTSPHRHLPASDATVLVTLPRRTDFPRVSQSSAEPAALPSPSDLATVREWIAQARRDADPRWLTRALARLEALPTATLTQPETLLLRAETLQGLHRFQPALAQLEILLRPDPRHPGAWRLKAALHQLLGEYDTARAAILNLLRWGHELDAAIAAAALTGLTAGSVDTATTLTSVIRRHPQAPADIRAWGWSTAGEILTLHGDPAAAESCFRESLRGQPDSPYTTGALADLLLEQSRPSEVIELLRDATSEGLRLRLAEALSQSHPSSPELRILVQQIQEGFELSHWRGDALHLREQARFTLRLR
ncbi:MAG: hypothetical protein IT580_21255, partial [Verrucomicrobiales bacterium]|nr:hypothetical protein [Verrucomicrobiales bacterium]